ncbi:hypothetical protein [Chamaesiphon sp. OTE_75_metabat_556]|uniref:hypothetical protein n=1 Tax=Chamaesiphon sp. OTE_75_metabat_556 TaxID=2964692 RepID=UPI00286CB168|nr:hypothetical protein [Chamaesiphon sp. OTE_75_metabat_556]
MRFLYSGIGFNLALVGLSATNLTAIASPATLPLVGVGEASPLENQVPSHHLTLRQDSRSTSNLTVIKGNGVEFTVPAGFKGGRPTSEETKAIIAAATELSPTMASFAKLVDSDPAFIRAMAFNTTKPDLPEVVLITRLPIPATVTMSELEATMAKVLPSMLPESFKLVEHKLEQVGARQIVRLTVTADIQGATLKESIGLFREGNEVFQVTYVYSGASARQAQPTFEQIINTFKAVAGGSGSAVQG